MRSDRSLRIALCVFWWALFLSQSAMDAAAIWLLGIALFRGVRDPITRQGMIAAVRTSRLPWLFGAWLSVLAVGLFVISPFHSRTWAYFLEFRWMLELGLWIWLLKDLEVRREWLPWVVGAPLLNALYGLFVVASGVALVPTDYFDRVGGFFGNPMPFAHTMGPVLAALVGAGLVAFFEGRRWNRSYAVAVYVIGLSVLLSMTRGVWIGLFVAFLAAPFLFRLPYRKSLTAALALATLLLVLTVAPLRERALQSFDPARSYDSQRAILWAANLEVFRSSPLFGVGYTNNTQAVANYFREKGYPEGQFVSHAHNQYLHFLAGTGILGLGCFLIFLGVFFRRTWLVFKQSSDLNTRALAAGLMLAQITFHVSALTESNFSIAKNRMMLLFLLAAVGALWWRKRTSQNGPT